MDTETPQDVPATAKHEELNMMRSGGTRPGEREPESFDERSASSDKMMLEDAEPSRFQGCEEPRTDQRIRPAEAMQLDTRADNPLDVTCGQDPMNLSTIDNSQEDWKDYSCATSWEFFVNDLENAMRELEGAAGWSGRRRSSESAGLRKDIFYNGRVYVLRVLPREHDREVRMIPFAIGLPEQQGSVTALHREFGARSRLSGVVGALESVGLRSVVRRMRQVSGPQRLFPASMLQCLSKDTR